MSVSKIAEGKYKVDIRPQGRNGRRYRKTFATKAEALSYERWCIAKNNNKGWLEKPADRRTLSELIEIWWGVHGATLKSGKDTYNRLRNMDKALNYPRANKINKKLISEYQALRISEGREPETINKERWHLSGVFTVLIKTGNYHSEHPLKDIKKIKNPPKEMGFLTHEQINTLISNLSGDTLKAAKLSLSTGGRWGEIKSLKRSSVIKYKVTYTNTKNGKPRTIPITKNMWKEITEGKEHILFQDANYTELRNVIGFLFPFLPAGQAVHVLRHTFASHFMMNGGNILTLQKILGHSTITQTMVYAHFAPEYLQDAAVLNPLEKGAI